MFYFALAVFTASLAALYGQHQHYAYLTSRRRHSDSAKLSAGLEAKLAEMVELKSKMNHLLIKNGLGNKS